MSKYQTISSSASGGTGSDSDVVISFESNPSNAPAGVVSDRVKAASRLFAKGLNDHDSGQSISDGER